MDKDIFEIFKQFTDEMNLAENKYLNYRSLSKNFLKSLNDLGYIPVDAADFENCLRESRNKKEKQRDMLLYFYKYYEKKTGVHIESDLENKIIIDDQNQRRIAIIKYLQNNKNTTAQIADVFMLNDRTIREDLLALEDGIHIMDSDIQVDIQRDGWKRYMEASLHPVLLNLSMPEVVAMTIGLIELSDLDPIYSAQYKKIATDVYSKLTEYAKGKLRRIMEAKGINLLPKEQIEYENQLSNALITMLKAGCKGNIQSNTNGTDCVYINCTIENYEDGIVFIKTSSGADKQVPAEDIFSCEYFLKREFE